MKRWFTVLFRSMWRGIVSLIRHEGGEYAGYLAFLGLLSLFPFLVFFIALAGFIGQIDVVSGLLDEFFATLPSQLVSSIQPRVHEIVSGPPQGLLTVAIIGAIWTASSALEGTRGALNRAYHVADAPNYFIRRLLSIVEFIGVTIAIFMAMFLLIFLPVFWSTLRDFFEFERDYIAGSWHIVRYIFAGLILFLGVGLSYYILPNIKQRFRSVILGAFLVVVGWLLAADLLVSYLRNFNQLNVIYGSITGYIVTLVFFYVMAVIYIWGAEFNYHFEKAMGHRLEQRER